jgi:hypothetical protein
MRIRWIFFTAILAILGSGIACTRTKQQAPTPQAQFTDREVLNGTAAGVQHLLQRTNKIDVKFTNFSAETKKWQKDTDTRLAALELCVGQLCRPSAPKPTRAGRPAQPRPRVTPPRPPTPPKPQPTPQASYIPFQPPPQDWFPKSGVTNPGDRYLANLEHERERERAAALPPPPTPVYTERQPKDCKRRGGRC